MIMLHPDGCSIMNEERKKEITVVICKYLADHDGDQGTIQFDLVVHTMEVVDFLKWDPEEHPACQI